MRIRFVAHDGGVPLELRRRVEQRLRLVVGRRAPSVAIVELSLTRAGADASAPLDASNGTSQCCRIRARLVSGVQLLVEEWGPDIEAAVDVAAWRLDRRLDRAETRGLHDDQLGR